ncbi:unnamed protein product, partial [Musa textilis]
MSRFAIPYRTGVPRVARYGTVRAYRAVCRAYRAVPLEYCYRPIYLRIDRYGRYQAYRPVEGGPRTGILSDRYVPPVPGGTARNCIPWY